MKKLFFFTILLTITTSIHAQSDSYMTMKDTFRGGHDVHHFSVSGFLCRTVLTWADEPAYRTGRHEFRDAITDVQNIKLITVPKSEFTLRKLTVDGFKKVLEKDSFQELAHFRDNGDYVTFYLQENKKNKNRYFILVDEGDNVVGIEMKGYVDMNKLMSMKPELAMNN